LNEVFFTFVSLIEMKSSACILVLYFLVLMAMPCFDVPNDVHIGSFGISQTSTAHTHEGGDLCSPFCACSCCVSPVISQDYVIHITTFQPVQDYDSCYITSYKSSLFASIWQPPKIG
jgi:hypothetical protein